MDVYETATNIVCAAVRDNFGLAAEAIIDVEKTFGEFDVDDLDIAEILMLIEDRSITFGFMIELEIDDISATHTIASLIDKVTVLMAQHIDPSGSWSACKKQMDAIDEHMAILRARLRRLLTKDRSAEDDTWLKTTAETLDATALSIRSIRVPTQPWLTPEALDAFEKVPEIHGPA